MPGRKYNSAEYRYGFNGKEKDNEGEFGSITNYDYGFRIYNPAIGKFLSVDPLTKSYPYYTPYQFAGNKPIQSIDLDGLEEFEVTGQGGEKGTVAGPYKDEAAAQASVDEGTVSPDKYRSYTLSTIELVATRVDKQNSNDDSGNAVTGLSVENYSPPGVFGVDLRYTGASSALAVNNGFQRTFYYKPIVNGLTNDFRSGKITKGEYSIGRYLAQKNTKGRLSMVGRFASESPPFGKQLWKQQSLAYKTLFLDKPLSKNALKTRTSTNFLGKASFGLGLVGVAYSGYQSVHHIANADDTSRAVAQEVGGWSGALLFGEAGAYSFGSAGTFICGPPCGLGGAFIGGIGGGIFGYIQGYKFGDSVHGLFTK